MRRSIVAGNWKMHKTAPEAEKLIRDLAGRIEGCRAEVLICPPFTALDRARRTLDSIPGTALRLGAQTAHYLNEGAHTGEISLPMLKDLGVEFVIVGHSERRMYYGETDAGVNRKAHAALDAGVTPIVCVGEGGDDRQANRTAIIVLGQIEAALEGLTPEQIPQIVIAYEPIWAIGTGLVATPAQAQEVHKMIRGSVAEKFGAEAADAVRIQYGGSVKADNASGLFEKPDIDGMLVGGAALAAEGFAGIVRAAD